MILITLCLIQVLKNKFSLLSNRDTKLVTIYSIGKAKSVDWIKVDISRLTSIYVGNFQNKDFQNNY